MSMFTCDNCKKQFITNSTLRRHVRQFHKDAAVPEVRRGRKPKHTSNESVITCNICGEKLVNKRALIYHRKRKHEQASFQKRRNSERRALQFDNFTDFNNWKCQEEDTTMTQFIKATGDRKLQKQTVTSRVYYCNRSGRYIAKDGRLRHLKIQGTCKIGGMCPAAMFVKICPTGGVSVSYYTEHCGHSCDVAHIRLRRQQREAIAVKLAAGIPYDDVLDSIHSTASVPVMTNMQFLSKQDLANISRDFGINKNQVLHKNDADSVAAWVHRTQQNPSTKNLVRLIKFQGEESSFNLRSEDFILILATDSQIIGAREFCRPGREVCMDSTHGLNSYDFQLTTLLAIDEHGEGFPVAFCYSNHVDEHSMCIFLQTVKEAMGYPLSGVILMTDDTEVYSNAWNAVMGKPAHRLLCTWHIDRAWRKNLTRIKGDSQLKAVLYKTLRAIMELPDLEKFNEKISQFLAAGKDDHKTSDFANYFDREYASRPHLWAYCYRLGLKVHHNMHLEAMHRVIKHVHLQGRKVHRLDKSIHALMKFMRSKMSDRLRKLHKGKWTRHVGGIRKRHQGCLRLNADQCSCINENTLYSVAGAHDITYMVRQNETVPHEAPTCPLMCSECNICVHAFSCTCLDSALRNTICKHIHLIIHLYKPVRHYTSENQSNKPDATNPLRSQLHCNEDDDCNQDVDHVEEVATNRLPTVLSDICESDAIISDISSRRPPRNVDQSMSSAQLLWADIQSDVGDDAAAAEVVVEHMSRLRSLVAALKDKTATPRLPPPPTSHEPVNKLAPTQRTLWSTRKHKSKKREFTTSKPSTEEKEFLLRTLGDNEPVISQQLSTDHDYSGNLTSHVVNFEHSYA